MAGNDSLDPEDELMSNTLRESLLATTFVEMADTLVDDFDIVDLLTVLVDRCVDVVDIAAAGIMLANGGEELRHVASSSEEMRMLELYELQADDGPCPECYRTGRPILNARLSDASGRWPRFAPRAIEAGFRSVHALPMRLRGHTIGVLNLFRTDEGSLDEADVTVAQAFADVATIGILQHRAATEAQLLNEQLSNALNSRVVIEQAKGMAAERAGVSLEQAFTQIRIHARNHNRLLVDVARGIVEGTIPWPADG